MSMTKERVLSEALILSPDARAFVAERLLESLTGAPHAVGSWEDTGEPDESEAARSEEQQRLLFLQALYGAMGHVFDEVHGRVRTMNSEIAATLDALGKRQK